MTNDAELEAVARALHVGRIPFEAFGENQENTEFARDLARAAIAALDAVRPSREKVLRDVLSIVSEHTYDGMSDGSYVIGLEIAEEVQRLIDAPETQLGLDERRYCIEEPRKGWRDKASFTPEEKRKLRPVAETLAMLDGNAFFGMDAGDGGEWSDQYLPEAHALYQANGGDGGWAGRASFAAALGWRDMDSAPRNGAAILVHDGEDQLVVRWGHMTWKEDAPASFGWVGAGRCYPPQGRFIRWQPLPPAPEDAP